MSERHAEIVPFDEDEAITRHCRKRALQMGWQSELAAGDGTAESSTNGQEAILAALDWSLRLAARWHCAAIGAQTYNPT